jgi:hypothetical protein
MMRMYLRISNSHLRSLALCLDVVKSEKLHVCRSHSIETLLMELYAWILLQYRMSRLKHIHRYVKQLSRKICP